MSHTLGENVSSGWWKKLDLSKYARWRGVVMQDTTSSKEMKRLQVLRSGLFGCINRSLHNICRFFGFGELSFNSSSGKGDSSDRFSEV